MVHGLVGSSRTRNQTSTTGPPGKSKAEFKYHLLCKPFFNPPGVSAFFLITVIILIIIVNVYGVLIIRHLTYIISFHFHKSMKCRDLISPFTDGKTEAHMADKPKQCDSRACPELPCMVFPRYTGVVVPGARARPDALYCPASQLCTNQVKAQRCCC